MLDNRINRMRCGCNSNRGNGCNNNCRELTNKLRSVDFAIIETCLYLDAYPNCQRALDYYHKLLKEREQLADAVNQKCGPLTIKNNHSTTDWTWVQGPWPWEPDAN